MQETAKTSDICKRINSYNDACTLLGQKPLTIDDMGIFSEKKRRYMLAIERTTTVCEAMQEDKKPDFSDPDTRKYFGVWQFIPGSGWVFFSFGYYYAISTVGARLSLHERRHVDHVHQMEDLQEDWKIIMGG